MAFGKLNKTDEPEVRLDIDAEQDEYPFVVLTVVLLGENGEDGPTLADVLITSEAEADDLLREVTGAVHTFKAMLGG